MKFRNILLFLLIFVIFSGTASATWADTNSPYRANQSISNGTRPYQISLNISNTTGADTATQIYCNGHCNPNFTNIRPYLSDTTPLPYWIENNTTGKIYINDTSNGSVQIYYGNSSYTSLSNVTNTFRFGDDFRGDLSKWSQSASTWTITSSGIVQSTATASGAPVLAATFTKYQNITVFGKLKVTDVSSSYYYVLVKAPSTGTDAINAFGLRFGRGTTDIIDNNVVKSTTAFAFTNNAWYNYEYSINNTNATIVYVWLDGTSKPSTPTVSFGSFNIAATGTNIRYNGNVNSNHVDYWSNILVRDYFPPEQQWTTWYENSYSNNFTKNQNLTFSVLKGTTIKFMYNGTVTNWYVNTTSQGVSTNYFNYTFNTDNTTTSITVDPTSDTNITWNVTSLVYPLELLYPANGSTVVSPVTIVAREWIQNAPYTYTLATDNQFINTISTGAMTTNGTEFVTATFSLNPGTYYWKVKNATSGYTDWFNFTVNPPTPTPGGFNISVFDEQNTSKQIFNYSVQLYNTTNVVVKNSNITNGWTNFSTEIASGEYLIIVVPNGTFSNYYQRMVLANSPANVTMYLPNGTGNTIYTIAFSILDISGLYPYPYSTISIYKGGLLQDKSYFSADGTHPVYLINGSSYNIQIQHNADIFYISNYIPVASGTQQLPFNSFSVNTTLLNPFLYNITYTNQSVTLQWYDYNSSMNNFNFSVYKNNVTTGNPLCNLVTSVDFGTNVCIITNTSDIYYVVFTALMNDGTYRNQSFSIDYTLGTTKTSYGVSTVDGSPVGTGYYFDGILSQSIKNLVSLILIIVFAGMLGSKISSFGGILLGLWMLVLETYGWFKPLDSDPQNYITISLTSGLTFFAVLYYLSIKDRGQ